MFPGLRPVAVGTLVLRLHLPEAGSLKDKRRVVTGLIQRLRSRFGVSVAEIDDLESWQVATLGLATVSSSESVCRRLLDEISRWVETAGSFLVLESTQEMR
jgi:uncharacterized protein YlxP (DUF503 family)